MGFGALGLGFWALSSHCGLFPSRSCSKRICPPWSRFFISFLDVRLDKRKGRFHRVVHFNAGRVISALLPGGIFSLGFFSRWNSLDVRGAFLPVCSVLED